MDHQNEQTKPLALLSVKQILERRYRFYVPAYQRGYRWRPKQVELFIDDLDRFILEENDKIPDKKCPFYCLQAVVVKDNKERIMLEVIDGQQRLTTVLIILQALYTVNNWEILKSKIEIESLPIKISIVNPDAFEIEYEHREGSNKWLEAITRAYIKDGINNNTAESDSLKNNNSDYYHLMEAYTTAIEIFKKWKSEDVLKLPTFQKYLIEFTRFVWYNTSLVKSNDSEVDIFDRINSTKIELNNAELIKALLLQKDNFGKDTQIRDQMAIDWDSIEKRLQEPSFWGFVYSTRHPYKYETHIEYIFDLLKGKTNSDYDDYYFTFNKYYEDFPQDEEKRLTYVNKCWTEVQEMILHLEEWYNDRSCYHYIGYLLEYGKVSETETNISIPYLKDLLTGITKDQRVAKLKKMVKDTLKNLKAKDLFHDVKGNKVTQLLFLLNIQSEQNRKNETARFSFSSYKQIAEKPGWNEEHVASNVDYSPVFEEREGLASTLLEYFTGVERGEDNFETYQEKVRNQYPSDEKAKKLCEELWFFFTTKNKDDNTENELRKIYGEIMDYFDANEEDAFKEEVTVDNIRAKRREKDFIWNFALLNATTNKSYGNSIYPLKRQRIMSDEYYIYTPICTRALFEKAYSHKLSNLMVWSRKDAKDYWDYICNCLSEFLPYDFKLPFTY